MPRLQIYTYPAVQFAHLAIPEALKMLEAYVSDGITPEEFDSAKEALQSNYAFSLNTAAKRLNTRMRSMQTGRPYQTPAEYEEHLNHYSQQNINYWVKEKSALANMVVAVVGDPELLKPVLEALPFMESVEVLEIQP